MTQYVDSAFVPRPTCYRCFRPERLCYCDQLQLIDNQTRVIVVQHPREQFHPLNTARIAEYSLRSSVVIRQRPSGVSSALQRVQVSPDAAILFPSDDAEQLETLPPERHPKEIIVVDGTWSNAKTLLRDVPELQNYRRLKFTPRYESSYRIRKEPRADYLSTIESVAYVLRLLEPETEGIEHLEETFSKMIDRNISARRPSESGSRFQRRERTKAHQFPEELVQNCNNFVVAYCEGTSRFARESQAEETHSEQAPFEKEPLVVYLKRLGSGDTLRVLLRTKRQPPQRLLRQLALTQNDIDSSAVNRSDAVHQIAGWLGAGEIPVVGTPQACRYSGSLASSTHSASCSREPSVTTSPTSADARQPRGAEAVGAGWRISSSS